MLGSGAVLESISVDIGRLGQLLSGVGALGTIGVGVTLQRHNRRKEREQLKQEFHVLYAKFWSDRSCREARNFIAHDESYAKVAPIFAKRNEAIPNKLTREENKIITTIDEFLHVIVRAQMVFEIKHHDETTRLLWRRFGYWSQRIVQPDRRELYEYVSSHWGRPTLEPPRGVPVVRYFSDSIEDVALGVVELAPHRAPLDAERARILPL